MSTTKAKTKARVTIAQFDSDGIGGLDITFTRDGVSAKKVEPLTIAEHEPRGMTPLLDATAAFIRHIDKAVKKGTTNVGLLIDRSGSMQPNRQATVEGVNEFLEGIRSVDVDPKADGKVICVIVTDGMENASKDTSKKALQKLIGEREKQGWTFIYLGANQDAWGVGSSMGLSGTASGQSVNYSDSTPGAHAAAFRSVTSRGVGYLAENDTFVSTYSGTASNSTITAQGVELDADGNPIKKTDEPA